MKHIKQRPAGTTAVLTTATVFLAKRLGLDLGAEEAAAYVGVVTYFVSLFFPRNA